MDIDQGNSSSVFYGGIVFPKDFDYGADVDMNYKIRFIKDYTESKTNELYRNPNGPRQSSM